MILDGARDPRIFPMLLECHLEYACLYAGPLHPALEVAAPYLVQLDYDYKDTHRFIRAAWGNSWGVFLKSDASLRRIRAHLRSLLIVCDQKGSRLVFFKFDAAGHLLWSRTPAETTRFGRLRSVTRARNGDLLVTTANGAHDAVLRVSPR